MCFHSVLYLFLFICNFYLIHSSTQPEVSLEQGVVRFYKKTINDRQIFAFEGIPFAKPPIGKHRFKEAVPAGPWLGVYNATSEPPACLQLDSLFMKTLIGSEDCLYLNVYTPKLFGNNKPLCNHLRLSILGFLSTEDNVVPGNNGLKDQVLALKWIQKNIAAFGGNPNSVTLGGMSAGGASCHYHLLSPLSKGLFHRAICMSGVALNPWAMAENLKEKSMVIATDLGCPTDDSQIMINCLRNRPAEHIISQPQKFAYWRDNVPFMIFAPVIEKPSPTAFLSDLPVNIIKEKHGSDVPVIFSFARDEGLFGTIEALTKPEVYDDMKNRWDELLPYILEYNYTVPNEKKNEIAQKIKKYYNIDDTPEGRKNLIKLVGDRFFVAGIAKVAKLTAAAYTSPVYVYRFSYRGSHSWTDFLNIKEDFGVGHGDDVFYTLGYSDLPLLEKESDLEVCKQMLDVFESLIRKGSLGENWESVKQHLPKVIFTDIKGPNNFQLTEVDELGEESFWDSLGFDENLNLPAYYHDKL